MTEVTAPKVDFGELPPDPRGRPPGVYDDVAAALRSRPGEWAKVTTLGKAKPFVSTLRNGRNRSFPPTEFEAKLRGDDAWVRYIGAAS